jgi:hypothetical protein
MDKTALVYRQSTFYDQPILVTQTIHRAPNEGDVKDCQGLLVPVIHNAAAVGSNNAASRSYKQTEGIM